MSDFDPGSEWERVGFHEIKKDDWILVHTRITSDAPGPDEFGYAPVIRIRVDDEDTIFRRKPELVLPTNPGTIVRIVWSAFDHYTYRVTNKGNFREIKSGSKIKKENYPHIQEVHVLYVPEEADND